MAGVSTCKETSRRTWLRTVLKVLDRIFVVSSASFGRAWETVGSGKYEEL